MTTGSQGTGDLEVVREGHVQFFTKGIGNSWKDRYLVVTRAGVCDIFMDGTKSKRHNKKKGGGFHLQGGEAVETFEPKDKHVNFGFQVIESKKTWQFGTSTETSRNEWIKAFQNVLKQLNALIHLQKVMNKPNHNTMEGKLEFADALAKCGQLAKARRIFSKLIVDFNDNKAHRGYEEFLVKSCHDVYQAERHFLRRIRFFVVPKTFLSSREGQQFIMIAHRISFFGASANAHILENNQSHRNSYHSRHKTVPSSEQDELKQRQLESILPEAVRNAKARNLEDDWPFHLYKVDNGYIDEAKALIKNWVKRIQYSERKFEYMYEEIESIVWDLMESCAQGKKGTTRLEFRLKAVKKDKADKIATSKDEAVIPVDLKDSMLAKSQRKVVTSPSDQVTDGVDQVEHTLADAAALAAAQIAPASRSRTTSAVVSEEESDEKVDKVPGLHNNLSRVSALLTGSPVTSDAEEAAASPTSAAKASNGSKANKGNKGSNGAKGGKNDKDRDRKKYMKRMMSKSVISEGEMNDLDNLVGDILDTLDVSEHEEDEVNQDEDGITRQVTDFDEDEKQGGAGSAGAKTRDAADLVRESVEPALGDPSAQHPSPGPPLLNNASNQSVNSVHSIHSIHSVSQRMSQTMQEIGGMSVGGLVSLDDHTISNRGYEMSDVMKFSSFGQQGIPSYPRGDMPRHRSSASAAALADARKQRMSETTHFFESVSDVLGRQDNHVFPWTAFMLVWMMRRDNMTHIGGTSANDNQIRAVLEFVYLFARGCFCALQEHWEYTMLLTSLYHNAVDGKDPEDVKQKLCLQAVSVIGDEVIPFANKKAVFDFLREHAWLRYNQENVHKSTTRSLFLKGIKIELHRIQDELNAFYDQFVYRSKVYPSIVPISDKQNVAPVINRQDHDKVQGKCTWGPRKGNKYDSKRFKDVCANRDIVPPTPQKNEGNFDEAYLLFCVELAQQLDPHFQKRVRNVILSEIPTAVHYPSHPKTFERAYHRITHDLQHLQSPRASRICDYCRCVVGFQTLGELKRGFNILAKAFRLCKIVNTFTKQKQVNVENYQYLDVYVLAQHPQNQFNKLVCEVRLTLQKVRDLDFERRVIRDCFENNKVLSSKEIASIMKDIARESSRQVSQRSVGTSSNNEKEKSRKG